MSDSRIKHILGFAAWVICLIVYLITLSPTVTFMDSGELAAVTYTFGIPHPTGYPLYLILGYIITHLPFGASPIWRLNFLSAFTSAAAVVIFYYAVIYFLKNFSVEKSASKERKKTSNVFTPVVLYTVALTSALCFGFTRTFWSNAVTDEVYGLHALFICVILYYSMRIYNNFKSSSLHLWSLFFVFLGLSFTNHLTMIFLLPSILYLIFLQYRAYPSSFKKIIYRSFLVLIPLLLYYVLIMAASKEPYFNWSNPVTLPNLFNHISGGDFSHLFLQSGGVFSKNLKLFGNLLIAQYWIVSFIVFLIGYVILFLRNRELFIFFTLLNVTCLAFGLNYNVIDVENYFTLLFISMGVILSLGLLEVLKYIRMKFKMKSVSAQFALAIGLILILTGFINNYSYNDNSKLYVSEDLTVNTLNHLDSNAVIVCYDWSTLYNTALYYNQVENIRPDVKIILVRLLAAPWYLNTLKKYYPELYNPISKEAEDYTAFLNSEPTILAPKLIHLVKNFFQKNFGKLPIYLTYDMFYCRDIPDLFNNYGWKPGSLCYRLTDKNEKYDSTAGLKSLDIKLRPFVEQSTMTKNARISTAGIYYDFATYHNRNGNKKTALMFLDKSLEIMNNFTDALKLKSKILSEKESKPK